MDRRAFLSLAGTTAAAAFAGCLDDEGGSGSDGDNVLPFTDDGSGQSDRADDPGDERGTDDNDGADGSDDDVGPTDQFRAVSRSSQIAIDEPESAYPEEAFELQQGDEPIVIEGEIEGERWEASTVDFPDVDVGVEASIEFPDGVGGRITAEEMTLAGRVRISIEVTGDEFEFDLDATTGSSGALTGAAEFGERPPTATLVDNEFLIDDETETGLPEEVLGFPSTEPGRNWFEIDLEFE